MNYIARYLHEFVSKSCSTLQNEPTFPAYAEDLCSLLLKVWPQSEAVNADHQKRKNKAATGAGGGGCGSLVWHLRWWDFPRRFFARSTFLSCQLLKQKEARLNIHSKNTFHGLRVWALNWSQSTIKIIRLTLEKDFLGPNVASLLAISPSYWALLWIFNHICFWLKGLFWIQDLIPLKTPFGLNSKHLMSTHDLVWHIIELTLTTNKQTSKTAN